MPTVCDFMVLGFVNRTSSDERYRKRIRLPLWFSLLDSSTRSDRLMTGGGYETRKKETRKSDNTVDQGKKLYVRKE